MELRLDKIKFVEMYDRGNVVEIRNKVMFWFYDDYVL